MKKFLLTLAMMMVAMFGAFNVAEAASICTDVPGCENAVSPRYPEGVLISDSTRCTWYISSGPHLYFDECRTGGEWYHYGPDDTAVVDGYVCYQCGLDGNECGSVRDLQNGNSKLICYNCNCSDYLSGFPEPPCSPITGDSCVDQNCCVNGDSFTDFRDGLIYTGNHGKYSSCVAQARKDCGLIPASEDKEIQKKAAQTDIFNPSMYIDLVVGITLILVIYLVYAVNRKRSKK